MNNQARICNLKCKHNIQGVCYTYGECIAKDLFVAELEKIKAEILSYKKYKDFSCMGTVYDFEIKKVFDNHIKELKGE